MQDNIPYQQNELLNLVAQGDEQAFRKLFSDFRVKVYNTALYLLHSETQAEDVLQEVFLKLWVHRAELTNVQHFPGYLNTITRNHIYNAFRKMAGDELLLNNIQADNAYEKPVVLDGLAYKELQEALTVAMENLTPQQRKVFELSRLRGLKHQEIAEELGLTRETVKKHLTDALRTIRTNLQYNGLGMQLLFSAWMLNYPHFSS